MHEITTKAYIPAKSTKFGLNWWELPNGEPPRVYSIDEEKANGYISIWSPYKRDKSSDHYVVFVEILLQILDREDKTYVKLYEGDTEEILDSAIKDFNYVVGVASVFQREEPSLILLTVSQICHGFFKAGSRTIENMRNIAI